jgi:fused signal recognition particle receptor
MSNATDNQPRRSWRERLFAGLAKTRQSIGGSVRSLFARGKVDDELLEELETLLLSADVGVEATVALLEDLKERARRNNLQTPETIQAAMVDSLSELLQPLESPLQITPPTGAPFVIMVAGINGAGKTTTLGKLAHHFQAAGHSVLLAAGDTFRAAAREQLQAWGERNNVTVIAQEGGDPSAVIFDAVHAAKARGIDIVLADTAGRLPTQMHLMDEIAKIRRVITKAEATAPHEVLLVLDGTIGQNAIGQVKAFDKAIGVTGLVITKLDGSAKGGVIAAIAKQCPKPVRYVGVGEQVEDLQPFTARAFAEALLGQ